MNALEALTAADRELVHEVLSRRDEHLLIELERGREPTTSARERIVDAMASEFEDNVSGPEWEPTEHGRRVDDALGRFLLRFPIEKED